jgi:chorismate mutase
MNQKDGSEYYIVRARAVPPILRGVVEANRLLASGKARTVHEAVRAAGISRSSYYKFKDDIEEFHDYAAGTSVSLYCELDDEPGLLAEALSAIAAGGANILTIHQSIPLNGVAGLSVNFQTADGEGSAGRIIERLEALKGIGRVRIIGRASGKT